MRVETRTLEFETRGNTQVLDITRRVAEAIRSAHLTRGIVSLFVPGSTGALTTMEHEPGAVEDLQGALERLFPRGAPYRHNHTGGDDNGHSHLRASLLGPSLTVPVEEGRMRLGTWQQIVFIDMDTRPRRREIVVQFIGE
ncbi:MAG: YjbQ family protein [Euryarchaeota archaeon]|nr:YjbQ family protein [Euryarchaeota archaeon]